MTVPICMTCNLKILNLWLSGAGALKSILLRIGSLLGRCWPRSLTNRVFALYGVTLLVFFGAGLGMFIAHQYRTQVEETQRASVMLSEVVAQAVQQLFGAELQQRQDAEREDNTDVPIFVCSVVCVCIWVLTAGPARRALPAACV